MLFDFKLSTPSQGLIDITERSRRLSPKAALTKASV